MSSTIERAVARLYTAGSVPDHDANSNVAPFPDSRTLRAIETVEQEKQREKTNVSSAGIESSPAPLQFDFNALARDGYLTPETMHSSLAEQYRLLKHSLIASVHEPKTQSVNVRNLIAITSALRGEGKTFTSFNLAMSLAMERDISVLLIDGDLIARSLSRMMGLNTEAGLVDAILDPELDVEKLCLPTNADHLRLLPAGKSYQHVMELMNSDRMREILKQLSFSKNKQIVLFDAPPLLSTTLAITLTGLVDLVLVVVEEGKTLQNAVRKALSLVANDNVGIVLNKCKHLKSMSYY